MQINNGRSFWLMHCWAGTFAHTLPPQCVNEWESAWANVAQNGMCQHFHRQSLSCPWNALWGLLDLEHTKIQGERVSAWQWWIAAWTSYLQGSHCCYIVGASQRSRSHWLQRSDVLESANRDKISLKNLKQLKHLRHFIWILKRKAGRYN